MAFSTLSIDLVAKVAKFEEDMNRAGRSVDKLNRTTASLSAGLKGLFSGVTVGALAAFAKSGIDAADSLNDMSKRLGVSVKDLASFKLAAEQSGTSLDGIGAGIARLNKSIGEADGGNKKLASTLATLGVTARDPKEAFFQLADAVERIQSPTERAALLSQVLGKNYQELIPLLAQGSAELRKSATASETFADAMARLAPEADKFNDNLATLKINAAGAAGVILAQLVPALNQLLERYSNLAGLKNAKLFDGLSGTVNADLRKVNGEIASIESNIARLTKNSGGKDSSILPLSNDLARLKALRAELQALAVASIQAPPQTETQRLIKANRASTLGASGAADTVSKTRTTRAARPAAAAETIDIFGSYKTTSKQVADFIRDQEDAINDFNRAISQDSIAALDAYKSRLDGLLSGTATAQTGELLNNVDFLNEAFFDGKIGATQYAEAIELITGSTKNLSDATEKTASEMDEFAKSAAQNMQTAFADFLFDPFDQGLEGMVKSFGKTIQRMVADSLSADLMKNLFGETGGGSGSGLFGDLLSGAGDIFGDLFSGIGSFFGFSKGGIAAHGRPLPLFSSGGVSNTAAIFGEAGPEAAVPLPDGRSIPVKMMGGGGHTIIVNVNGSNNAPDVRRAAGQGAREALGMLSGAQRYA